MKAVGEPLNSDFSKYQELTIDELWKMHQQYLQEAEECKHVNENALQSVPYLVENNTSKFETRKRIYYDFLVIDPKTDGFVMNYPHGNIIRQSERSSFFRGENKQYKESIATLHRKLKAIPEKDQDLYHLVADMRIAEFELFIRQFSRVEYWENSGLTVLFEPLAQHYGLETEWLDITNDFDTALFFATCRWDSEKNDGIH